MPRTFRRAYVLGAYLPNGGTWMAYHLGAILARDFGIETIAVTFGAEGPDDGIHRYDLRLPSLPVAQMEREVGADDLLLINPSFSPQQFGWRLPGTKLSYVQDFKTFALLDRKIDHYVAVSDFVRDFLRTVYAIDAPVVPAFIELDDLPPAPPWRERPAHAVLPYRKGMAEVWELSYAHVRAALAQRAPHIQLLEPLPASGLAQRELLARLGQARYFLTLSAAEGFGLVPLEAMAMGTVAIGYDAFGGRQYFRDGANAFVAPYPDIDGVVERVIAAVADAERAERVAAAGRATAAQYGYAAFRERWIEQFQRLLGIERKG